MKFRNHLFKTMIKHINKLKKNIVLVILPLSTIFFLYSIAPAFSIETDNELDLLLQKIKNNSSKVQALSCNFSQTRHLAIFTKPVLFSGILTLSKPDKLRWEVTEPIPSVILLNDTKGMRCSGNTKPFSFDLASGPQMRMIYKQFFQWLSGTYDSLHEFYDVKQLSDYKIALKPLDEKFSDIINSIEIEFEPVSLQPLQVLIRESQDDYTDIIFSNYNLSPNLKESLFTECNSM
jgi:outer membrane lipoprotein-sorting protein